VPASKILGASTAIPDRPERFGPSLAHIVMMDEGREIVLGQAWLAAPNTLVTCGHVVEQFINYPNQLTALFPFSGNCYAVQQIFLHPSFVRQPDQLVKFDVAAITVSLAYPETEARPLPFGYEHELKPNQNIATVRYPVHLGQLTAAPQPLAQEGYFLGHLRKHDNFHLLHDLALAPGDSGAPMFDGDKVVAIHCGDTASLPGLNLPTTSIRMALWVDALQDLELKQTAGRMFAGFGGQALVIGMSFLVATALMFMVTCFVLLPKSQHRWAIEQPQILPVDVSLNKPLHDYNYGDQTEIVLLPRSDCYLYLFDVDAGNQVMMLYPPQGVKPFVKAGQARTIDRFGSKLLKVNRAKDKLHMIALISDFPLVNTSDMSEADPGGEPLKIDGNELLKRIREFQRLQPDHVLHLVMDAPTAR